VENFAKTGRYIPGIGHRQYRLELPDPRVSLLKKQALKLSEHVYLDFACSIEKVTTAKKANLILNVDGAIGAILMDFLKVEEKYSHNEIEKLIEIEFFNAFFVLSRSVGLTAHYLDQRRLNEPLFRLENSQVLTDFSEKS
jgi:citrate synthase